MVIDLYTVTWNERRLLPFFLENYEKWVDRFIVFDDGSDDGTAETLSRHPKVELRPFPPKGASFVLTAAALWQQVWKESRGRADWVLVTNMDEFFYHPRGMRAYLEDCTAQGVTIIHPRGYEMVGEAFPAAGTSLVEQLPLGVPVFGYDKRQLFNPGAIAAINFAPGRHSCAPTGTVVEPNVVETAILHYKYVDPQGYTIPRQGALARRMLPGDLDHGFGSQYRMPAGQLLYVFEWLKLHATRVVDANENAQGYATR